MLRRSMVVAVLLTVGTLSPLGAQEPKKEPTARRDAEIRLLDGSSLKGTLLDTLEVTTRYGKLAIPMTDLRRIEFGLHLSDEAHQRLELGIKGLGDEAFLKREEAVKDLVALGAIAYPALKVAAKSTDQEIALRARQAMERLKEKVPASQLNLKAADTVLANDFTVVGRVSNASLKVRTIYLGDLELKVTDIRQVRWAGSFDEETDVTVEADKYAGLDNAWMDTTVTVEAGTAITISAAGRVDLMSQQNPNNFISGPEGRKELRHQAPYPPGTLLGRLGENGEVFIVGTKADRVPAQDGKLYLRIVGFQNGFPNNQATGSYKAHVTGVQKAPSSE